MKKLIFTGIGSIVVITGILAYCFYLQGIDTKYAIKYSQVFGSYDIKEVDAFLSNSTVISYKGMSSTYGELRKNIVEAFEEKHFSMLSGSSYGHGNNRFVNGVQEVGIQVFVNFNKKSSKNNDETVIMQLEKIGINKFVIKSLSSNGDFFGYLFFGINK